MSDCKYIEINGSKIHYVEEGKGKPMLFLHGMLTSSYLWRNVIPILSKRARCIAPDLIGMGESDKPDIRYTFSHHLKYIHDFIEKLQLKNITLVLHGFGAFLGFDYAMKNPENINGIAFYEPNFKIEMLGYESESLLMQELIHVFAKEPNYAYKKIVEENFLMDKMLHGISLNKLSNEAKNYYQKPFKLEKNRELLWQHFKEFYLDGSLTGKTNQRVSQYIDFLQRSSIPKLLLYSNPGFNTSMTMVSWLRDNLPNIKLADLEEGMHLAQESNPYSFSQFLFDWYKNI